jgi:hypothetical protein
MKASSVAVPGVREEAERGSPAREEVAMYVADVFSPDFIAPFLVLSIPIIAIVGGITAGIVRQIGRHRLIELAQQERIAAIQRGIDPSQLPPLPIDLDSAGALSPYASEKRRAQGFLTGGVITLFVGLGVSVFLMLLDPGDHNVWAVGLIPAFAGVALIISAAIVWPRGGDRMPPRP